MRAVFACVLVAFYLLATPALAATRLVSTTGTDSANDCTASPCATVSHAVAQASDGDTIQIGAGTFANDKTTTGLDLTFAGAGAGSTTLDSTGQFQATLDLSGTDTVQDLTLTTSDPSLGGPLVAESGAAVTVDHAAIVADPAEGGNGSGGISAGGASLVVRDSTVTVTDPDSAIANSLPSSCVVQDGSGIEATSGTVSIIRSTVRTVRGIALRIHGGTTSTDVRDSVLESSGAEDYTSSQPDYAYDRWPVVEAATGPLTLTGDTVYNATPGVVSAGDDATHQYAHTDGVWAPGKCNTTTITGNPVTLTSTVVQTQPNTNPSALGADLYAGGTITAGDSAFTTTATLGSGSVPAVGTNGNIPGDPGFVDPVGGDFRLAPGSALTGAGDGSALTGGETGRGGGARGVSCSGGALTNVGAYETVAPACPAALSTGDTTGALAQVGDAGNCVTGDTAAHTGCGAAQVAGLTGGTPTDVVQSPDATSAYVATEDADGKGVDITELHRAADGALSPLPAPDNCLSSSDGSASGCGNATGLAALKFQLNGFTSQPVVEPARMAISPDGTNLYLDNGATISEFARNPSTGALTPLASDACITQQAMLCHYQQQFQIGPAAALLVAPNGRDVYLATLNQCSFASFRARARGDEQNPNCANDHNSTFATADISLLTRDASTGTLAPTACYTTANTAQNGCTTGFDGLYGMTSLALSPDAKQLYVTSQVGSPAHGLLSRDPGEIDELARNESDGTLTQMSGSSACVTAGTGCGGSDAGVQGVPGVADPQQIVVSPDGLNAYVTGAEYLPQNTGNGPLVTSTLAQLARDPSTGVLGTIPGATCFTGLHQACATAGLPGASRTQDPPLTGAEGLAISPDGQSVYATAQVPATDFAVDAFSRADDTGLLTPLSGGDLCLASGTPPGASAPFACGDTAVAGLSSAVGALPGGVGVASDCKSVYVMSNGVTALARSVPPNAAGCFVAGPHAGAVFDPPGLSFSTAPGTSAATQAVMVRNGGTDDLTFGAGALVLAGADAVDFTLGADGCSGQTLAPGHTCTFSVAFHAPAEGTFGATVRLTDNAPDSPQTVGLHGVGAVPHAAVSPAPLAFGSSTAKIPVGKHPVSTVTLTDTGTGALAVGALALSGDDAGSFGLTADGCSGQTLVPSGSCTVGVVFSPGRTGSFAASLDLPDSASDSPLHVALSGVAGVPSVALGATSLAFSADGAQDVTLTNSSADTPLDVRGVSVSGPDAGHFGASTTCGDGLAPGAQCQVSVGFATSVTGTFTASVHVDDDSADSPQTITLSASERIGQISGHVYDGTQPGDPPVPGTGVGACLPHGRCVGSAVTDATGAYAIEGIKTGAYVLQVQPPSPVLNGSSAIASVTATADAQDDFVLHAPDPGPPGVGFSSRVGESRSGNGVARLAFTQPYSMDDTEHVAMTGPADADKMLIAVAGVGTDDGSFAQAGANIVMVHYDHSGNLAGYMPIVSSPLGCSGDGCGDELRSLASGEAGGPVLVDGTSVSALLGKHDAATRTTVTGATDDCSGPKLSDGFNIVPNADGGIDIVRRFPDGSTATMTFDQAQFPSGDNGLTYTASYVANVALSSNVFISGYNALIASLHAYGVAEQQNNLQLNTASIGNVAFSWLSTGLNAETHGAGAWFVQVASQFFGQLTSYQESLAHLNAPVDCPHKHGDLYFDPSGVVTTPDHVGIDHATVVLRRSATAKGAPKAVPDGSAVMSPQNRKNPDHTDVDGGFGWDTAPGFFSVAASHSGCSAAHTSIFAVPPPRADLALVLRCPHLRRATTRVKLHVYAGRSGSLTVVVRLAPRHGKARAGALAGALTLRSGKTVIAAVPVPAAGPAVFPLPPLKKSITRLTVGFGGNGHYAPSSATARRQGRAVT